MDFFNRTPIKNDILSIIGHLSSRKKSSHPLCTGNHLITSSCEIRPSTLHLDESHGFHFDHEKSDIGKNSSFTVENTSAPSGKKSPMQALLKTNSHCNSSILGNSYCKSSNFGDYESLNFFEPKTTQAVFSDDLVAQSSALTTSVLKYNVDTSTKENVIPSDSDDNFFTTFLESSKADVDKSISSSDSNKKSLGQTANRSSNNIKSHASSSDDDDAFENFLKSQQTKINKIEVNQVSEWSSWDSDDDDRSSCDSPYQTFYYRVNNKLHLSDTTKLPSRSSESKLSDSKKKYVVPDRKTQSCSVQVSKYPHISKYQKISYKIEQRNSQCVSTEEFVYSLYPVDNNDNRKQTSHEKLRHPDALKFVQKFKPNRSELADKLYQIYNEKIFSNQLPPKLEIIWSRRLLKTAGLCKYMMRTSTHSNGTSNQVRIAQILLSEKVCTTAERVRDTLLHEICHAAVWLINGLNDGHGRHWKSWANRVHRVWPKLPVVSVCHAYTIDTRFTYRCTGCGVCINRHSKSLDITKKICGHCRSKFELLINTPKGRMLRPSLAAQYDKRLLPHCSSNNVTKMPCELEKYQLSRTPDENNRNHNVENGLSNMFKDLRVK
ncbi:unnamed protein product [Schistosoma intercalatum]|nr:unnamed protein product [Schistosoma intercalatum]CAH8531654.1 unnamed protein product [Schistosoma intercalatum]